MSTLFYVDTIIRVGLLGRKTSFNDRLHSTRHVFPERRDGHPVACKRISSHHGVSSHRPRSTLTTLPSQSIRQRLVPCFGNLHLHPLEVSQEPIARLHWHQA